MDSKTNDSQRYADYLKERHDKELAKVGGEKVYDYTSVFNGFAAKMTAEQAQKLVGQKDVLSVDKAEMVQLDTSSTTAFLASTSPRRTAASGSSSAASARTTRARARTSSSVTSTAATGRRTRASPNVKGQNGAQGNGNGNDKELKGSQYDKKVPAGFTGICQAGEAFPATTCNGKVIAARWFADGVGLANIPDYEFASPRDYGATARTPPRPPRQLGRPGDR